MQCLNMSDGGTESGVVKGSSSVMCFSVVVVLAVHIVARRRISGHSFHDLRGCRAS
jgi:hypothetical protein